MAKYSFSQLIIGILPQIQGVRARVYQTLDTLSQKNAGFGQNSITPQGGATLARLIVTPPQCNPVDYTFVVAPQAETQGRHLQLRKENI
ncbi:MAG: hypothetical protein AAB617_01885 [Patescibacteria group bacterium]